MKKLFMLLTALTVMMLSATAFAANEQEALTDGADITVIRRMALAEPLYNPMKDAPSLADVSQAVYDAAALTKVYVISYGDIAANIKRDTDVDIRPLNHRQAMKIFRLCVPKYVDAYVVPTIANNNRKTVFFDVYQIKTDALLYRYQLTADKHAEDSYITYKALSEQFFKRFDRAIENQKRRKAVEAEKQAKLDLLLADPEKRAEYEKKSEEEKQKALAKEEKRQAREAKEKAEQEAAARQEQERAQARAEKKRRKAEERAQAAALKDQERAEQAARREQERAEKAALKTQANPVPTTQANPSPSAAA